MLQLRQKLRIAISTALLSVFLYPLFLKAVHHHDIAYVAIDRVNTNIHQPVESCEIFQFEYLSFIVDENGVALPSLSVLFRWVALNDSIPFVAAQFYYSLRAPPYSC